MPRSRFAFLDHPGVIAFAHRGGSLEAFENTWTSFSQARDLGYRYMETDVHATADGVVLTIHDPDLRRVSNHAGLVREKTWTELSSVRLNGGEPIPRLDELLAAWPEIRWNIDAKHDTVVEPLIATLRASDAVERVCVTSFSDRRLTHIRREMGPRLCTAMGPGAVTALRIASLVPRAVGVLGTGPLGRFGAAQVPVRQWGLPLVNVRFVEAAHRIGLQVHVWTVDDESTMTDLIDVGVDGIMTDRPAMLKDVLERHRLWR